MNSPFSPSTPAALTADQIARVPHIAAWAAEFRRTSGKAAHVAYLGGGWYNVNGCSRWQKRHFVASTTTLAKRSVLPPIVRAGNGLQHAIAQARAEGERIPAWLSAAEDVAFAGAADAAADTLLSAISLARNDGEDIPDWLDKAEDEGIAMSESPA